MRNSNEISAELQAKMAEAPASEAERSNLASEIRNLTDELREAQINEAAARALANQRVLTPAEQKEVKRFSISKMLREAAEGRGLTGLEAEMNAEAEKEIRAAGQSPVGVGIPSFLTRYDFNNSATSTEGAEFKATVNQSYVEGLMNNLVAAKAGAQYLNGLKGNVQFVKGASVTASWEAEEASASTTKQTFGSVTMSPKRLGIYNGYSRDLLYQSALAVDAIIMNEMSRKHAEALDAAVFAGSGSSGQPTGIINNSGVNVVAIDTNGGPLTHALIAQLEKEVGVDNGLAGALAYVTNSKVLYKMKTTPAIAGYPEYLCKDGQTNGYPLFITNGVPSNLTKGTTSSACSAMVFGDFSQVVIGSWNGLQFIVDPYTSKNKGVIEVAAIAYHDVAIKHPVAFGVIKDITTT